MSRPRAASLVLYSPLRRPSTSIFSPLQCLRFSSSTALPRPSHAYSDPGPSRSPSEATSSTPSLSPEQHELVSRIIRVDHAGELGANWIYRGQKWAMGIKGDRKTVQQIEVGQAYARPRNHQSSLSAQELLDCAEGG